MTLKQERAAYGSSNHSIRENVTDPLMDRFKELYYECCKSYYVEPNDVILGEIEK